jgi:hypothetical protein
LGEELIVVATSSGKYFNAHHSVKEYENLGKGEDIGRGFSILSLTK